MKQERFEIRCTYKELKSYNDAAVLAKLSLSEWIRKTLTDSVEGNLMLKNPLDIVPILETVTPTLRAFRKPLSKTGWWVGNKWFEPKGKE